jgi:hypothetical protein
MVKVLLCLCVIFSSCMIEVENSIKYKSNLFSYINVSIAMILIGYIMIL